MSFPFTLSAINNTKKSNIVAIVGSYNQMYSSVADYLRIPYFITTVVPREEAPSPYHIRMIPDIPMFSRALRDLFLHYEWKTAGVLFDNDHGKI